MDFINLYEWILTITPADLPPPPIAHGQGVIVNVETWLANLQFAATHGAGKSPRAQYGALQEDLRFAYELATVPTSCEGSDSTALA